jgi:hypothetical protein
MHYSSPLISAATCPAHFMLLDLIILIILVGRLQAMKFIILLLTYLLTYLLTELSLLEELSIVQPLKNPLAFYGTRRFNTVLTRALHWSLS